MVIAPIMERNTSCSCSTNFLRVVNANQQVKATSKKKQSAFKRYIALVFTHVKETSRAIESAFTATRQYPVYVPSLPSKTNCIHIFQV